MENQEIKEANRKAMPMFILLVIAGAAAGGIMGFVIAKYGLHGFSENIERVADVFSTFVAPWMMFTIAVFVPLILSPYYMKTKKMPIVEVSKELKRELDRLDIISDTHKFYTQTGITGLDVELQKIASKHSDFFTYSSQVLMYLASTKNYVEEEKKQYHVLWGLVNNKYYVWSNKFIPFHANVFIKTFDSKEEAQNHADELNEFVEGK